MDPASTTATSADAALLLDPDIRDWVVWPLFVVMVAAGILRQYLGIVLSPTRAISQKDPRKTHLRQQAQTVQAQAQRSNNSPSVLANSGQRQAFAQQLCRDQAQWCETEQERIDAADEDAGAEDDPMEALMMNNPMDMLKGNMAFMVQNMIMMQGIQHFFSGFILLQVPFALTNGFKPMFQRGIVSADSLSSNYVSSVSWYFLCMYGLRGLLMLYNGLSPVLEKREQDLWLSKSLGEDRPKPGSKTPDGNAWAKTLNQQAEAMELAPPSANSSRMDQVEARLLGPKRMPRKSVVGGSGGANNDFLWQDAGSKKKRV